nr:MULTISPECIES: AAA family ATPase [unclassified Paraburkholderia]
MAKIVVVGNSKGGTGKSTSSLQFEIRLAREGARVWLVNGDRQETSVTAINTRAQSGRAPIAARPTLTAPRCAPRYSSSAAHTISS